MGQVIEDLKLKFKNNEITEEELIAKIIELDTSSDIICAINDILKIKDYNKFTAKYPHLIPILKKKINDETLAKSI